jgi:L-asparaginase
MNIKVIFTGGTIGSRTNGEYIGLGGCPYTLIENWRQTHSDTQMRFDTCEPYTILSENLSTEHLVKLAKCVNEQLDSADALIITHGTDTLCYTAAFLGYLFADSKIPILLVSSNYPLDDSRANGHENFAAAVDFAKTAIGGVYAVWTADGVSRIHLGVRTILQSPYSDLLQSVGNKFFGTVTHGHFEPFVPNAKNRAYSQIMPLTRLVGNGLDSLNGSFDTILTRIANGFGKILTLTCRPQMCLPPLNTDISAVMLESYHSGTMCADSRFSNFMTQAKKLNIPVFLAGAGNRDTDYESVQIYRNMGVIPLPAASPSAMYIKLSISAALGIDFTLAANTDCGDLI